MDTTLGHMRVALVVPKYGCTAVRRNRLKRRLRELARQFVLPLPASADVLLRARRDAYDASFAAIRDEVSGVAAQLT